MKSVLRSGPVQSLLASIVWGYMALVGKTTRWVVEGATEFHDAWDHHDGGLIFSCWHSRILLMPVGWMLEKDKVDPRRGVPGILISLSRDGEFVAQVAGMLGLKVIRGSAGNKKKKSKDKGGATAIREASDILGNQGVICITVDGPRGPRQRASLGAVLLAQRKGAKIVTYAQAATPSFRMKSWDRFFVAFPFGKGAIVFGPLIDAPRDVAPEIIRQRVEDSLNTATRRAEELIGLTFEPPAPLEPGAPNDPKALAAQS